MVKLLRIFFQKKQQILCIRNYGKKTLNTKPIEKNLFGEKKREL